MAPTIGIFPRAHAAIEKPTGDGLAIEAWSQGYMIGSLIIMAAITIASMRKKVILHKLILLELILGTFHGTWIFTSPPVYGWYLSTTAIFLNISWSLHNVIAWMKVKPFLSRRWSLVYIGTVILVQPYWVVEIAANFLFFNNINLHWFETTRPYEALFRDPWWIFTSVSLFYQIATHYRLPLYQLVLISPRFGVLLVAMVLSIAFIIADICAVTGAFSSVLPDGLNPFWKLAFVFKCLTDSIVLDDFKTALDRLMRYKLRREGLNSSQNGFGSLGLEHIQRIDTNNEDPLSDEIVEKGHDAGTETTNTKTSRVLASTRTSTKSGDERLGLERELAMHGLRLSPGERRNHDGNKEIKSVSQPVHDNDGIDFITMMKGYE